MDNEETYARERDAMIDHQLLSRGIQDVRVLAAMRSVPRHRFILPEYLSYAYSDGPLPIPCGQTISQPYIVAYMTELLHLKGDETVLEIGAGSGYQAAVLACLARQVHSIERHPDLAHHAESILQELGYTNVTVHTGDGSLGLIELAPFDAIIVSAAAPRAPQALLDQLAQTGRLVIPVGERGGQVLELWERKEDQLTSEAVLPVAFVPLVGKYGWKA
jgi:protein-L-isoaspartate(D-aspartate) O-methyltransferase